MREAVEEATVLLALLARGEDSDGLVNTRVLRTEAAAAVVVEIAVRTIETIRTTISLVTLLREILPSTATASLLPPLLPSLLHQLQPEPSDGQLTDGPSAIDLLCLHVVSLFLLDSDQCREILKRSKMGADHLLLHTANIVNI